MITVRNRKGISTFIATLLLMVLAVAAGVVIYAYTMGYLGSFNTPAQMGALSLDTYSMDTSAVGTTGTAVVAYIRNIGKTSFDLQTVYLDGKLVPKNGVDSVVGGWSFSDGDTDTNNLLAENGVGTVSITMQWSSAAGVDQFAASKTYELKIIGVDNTQLIFQIKK